MQSQISKLLNLSPKSLSAGDLSSRSQSSASGEFKFALEKEISVRGKSNIAEAEKPASLSQQSIASSAQQLNSSSVHARVPGVSATEAAELASVISMQHGSSVFELAMEGQKLLTNPTPEMLDLSAFVEGEQATLDISFTDSDAVLKLATRGPELSEVSGLNDFLQTEEGGELALVLPINAEGIALNVHAEPSPGAVLPSGTNLPGYTPALESGAALFNQEFAAGANVSLRQGAGLQLRQANLISVPANTAQVGASLDFSNAESLGVKTLAISALDSGEVLKAETKMPDTSVQILGVNDLASKFRPNTGLGLKDGLREGLGIGRFAMAQEHSVLASTIVEKSVGDTASSFSLGFQQSPHGNIENARMQMPVNISFGRPEWAGQVAERAAMMSLQKIQVAELQLDPPDLGSLHVKVTVNSDQQASVTFVSPHANVRDALDQSIVRLRDLLEQQGLDLVDVNVSDQQQEQGESSGEETSDNFETADLPVNEDVPAASIETISHYGVDFYA